MDKENFVRLVAEAVANLPQEFKDRLENIVITIEDSPTQEELMRAGLQSDQTLLGLYQGVPLTKRSSRYGMVPPDKITIYKKNIEEKCSRQNAEIRTEIRKIVQHEIAHHFGIDDLMLQQTKKIKKRRFKLLL